MAAATCALMAACGSSGLDEGPPEWLAETEVRGDTTVVRTLAGSEWGEVRLIPEVRIGVLDGAAHEMLGEVIGLAVGPEGQIYFYDRSGPALRKFAEDGTYIGTLGGPGAGPGEYTNSDGGIAVLPDGRVVLRDPGNGRFSVYDRDGGFMETWPTRSGAFTSRPLQTSGDGFFSTAFVPGAQAVVHFDGAGVLLDTIRSPNRNVEAATVSARSDNSMQTWNVPFTPTALSSVHPEGYFVTAVSDRYAIELNRGANDMLRIEMEARPVEVGEDERVAEEARVTEAMRQLDPAWRWNGAAIPRVKPLLRMIHTGEDGRIWVQLHQPGIAVAEGPVGIARDALAPPQYTLQEPTVFDVFESDGRYLGRVNAPDGLVTYPRPVMRGEHVWAVVAGELGVQSIVRFRISREDSEAGP